MDHGHHDHDLDALKGEGCRMNDCEGLLAQKPFRVNPAKYLIPGVHLWENRAAAHA
jgi:hypothetical protein